MSEPTSNFLIKLLYKILINLMAFFNKKLAKWFFPFHKDLFTLSFPHHFKSKIDFRTKEFYIETSVKLENHNLYDVLVTGAFFNMYVDTTKIFSRDKFLHLSCPHNTSKDYPVHIDLEYSEIFKIQSIFKETSERPVSLVMDLFFEIKTGRESFHYDIVNQRLSVCIIQDNSAIKRASELLQY